MAARRRIPKVKRSHGAKSVTAAQARAHRIAPAHVKRIRMEEIDPAREVRYKMPVRRKRLRAAAAPDLGALGLAIWKALQDKVSGYILQIRQNGMLVHVGVWNWAQTPADLGQGWTEGTRMHLASVSKLLTAVGTVKLLDAKGISYDTPIISYLPTYWSKGPNINKITFRHLFTHTSGLTTNDSSTDYLTMKSRVAAGVSGVGAGAYANLNFGLCRILISIINGNIAKGKVFSPSFLNDAFWDLTTINAYKSYMQAAVFTPSGVANADFSPQSATANALAYPFPYGTKKGLNTGDLATVAGGAGWRLSIKELLNVMNHSRRKATIVSVEKLQYILDNTFGIDQIIPTAAGKLYNKNGAWGWDGKTEQCVAYFLPKGMELAVFVNSPIGTSNFSLRDIVKDAYVNSLS
jgi:CubicO group peptidase (beta-lactamase class C family)